MKWCCPDMPTFEAVTKTAQKKLKFKSTVGLRFRGQRQLDHWRRLLLVSGDTECAKLSLQRAGCVDNQCASIYLSVWLSEFCNQWNGSEAWLLDRVLTRGTGYVGLSSNHKIKMLATFQGRVWYQIIWSCTVCLVQTVSATGGCACANLSSLHHLARPLHLMARAVHKPRSQAVAKLLLASTWTSPQLTGDRAVRTPCRSCCGTRKP